MVRKCTTGRGGYPRARAYACTPEAGARRGVRYTRAGTQVSRQGDAPPAKRLSVANWSEVQLLPTVPIRLSNQRRLAMGLLQVLLVAVCARAVHGQEAAMASQSPAPAVPTRGQLELMEMGLDDGGCSYLAMHHAT